MSGDLSAGGGNAREQTPAENPDARNEFNWVFGSETGHRILAADRSVQQTSFGNGVRVTANFGSVGHGLPDGFVLKVGGARINLSGVDPRQLGQAQAARCRGGGASDGLRNRGRA